MRIHATRIEPNLVWPQDFLLFEISVLVMILRKASVFCIVSLHQLAGEDLQPHLESLTGSKLKLLNLYIKRAQERTQFNRKYFCIVTLHGMCRSNQCRGSHKTFN